MGDVRWTTGRVESAGEEIYYEVTTPDEFRHTIVLGHGAGGSHAVWYQQVPVLARAHRVVTWDTRGFGLSTCRTNTLDGDIAAQDLVAVLEAVGAPEPVHLVGQSMGGWWLSAFAFRTPERIRSLTYTSTAGGLFTDALDEHFRTTLRSGVRPEPVVGGHFATGPRLTRENPAHAFLYQQLNTFHEPPMALVAPATSRRYDLDAFSGLGIPTLFIGSSDDALFPAALLRDVAERVGARYEFIEGAGHSPYFEQPDDWNRVYLQFLATVDEQGASREQGGRT